MFATRAAFLIGCLWVGSLWAIGYVAAPTLFVTLSDKVQAGTIAGSLFRTQAWLSVVCAVALLALAAFTPTADPKQRKTRNLLVIGMLVCTLIGYFGLQPWMAALRETAGPGGVMASDVRMQFGILHGLSVVIYLIESVLGAALLCKLR